MTPRRKPGPKKQMEATYLLKMPRELAQLVETAAKQDGVSLAEWWRAAGHLALLTRAAEANRKRPQSLKVTRGRVRLREE